MGWLDGKGEQRAAAQQAIRIADRLAVPFQAWSLARAEVTRMHRRVMFGALIVYVAIMAPITWSARGEFEQDPVGVAAIVGGLALFLGLLVLLTWYWARRAGDYRDPGIVIEVGEQGIVAHRKGDAQALGWEEIEAKLQYYVGKSGLRFVGVALSSRFGRIPLDDDWYRNGRLAAAVIVREITRAEEARARAKVEG